MSSDPGSGASATPGPTPKVIGVGLNRTGTKTLGQYFRQWGMRHLTYDLEAFGLYRAGAIDQLLDRLDAHDSCEDWPWPLIYREIDERFPNARFILTVRKDPETWFRSLCNLAVRMGPLTDYEQHIYGYAMPQGHRHEHIEFYERHNREVRERFGDRPGKLLEICWETDPDASARLADFLGKDSVPERPLYANRSMKVYSGDSLLLAQANRIVFQSYWKGRRGLGRLARSVGLSGPAER